MARPKRRASRLEDNDPEYTEQRDGSAEQRGQDDPEKRISTRRRAPKKSRDALAESLAAVGAAMEAMAAEASRAEKQRQEELAEMFKRPETIAAWRRVLGNGKFSRLNGDIWSHVFSYLDAVGASIGSKLCRITRANAFQKVEVFVAARPSFDLAEDKIIPRALILPSLLHVCLASCNKILDSGAISLAGSSFAGNLLSLNLTSTKVSDEGVLSIAATMTNLTQIRLSHCQTATDRGLCAVARSCTKLRWIDFSATGAGNQTLVALANSCPEMFFADFSWCPAGDTGLQSIARLSTNLLSLRVPAHATDAGVDAISQHCTTLSSIGFVRLQLTDDGLINAATRLTSVRSIHVAHCELVSDRGLEGMAAARPNLTAFNLRTPGMLVSDRGVGHVVRNCTELRSLKLRSCTRITDLALESIAVNLKNLSSLELHSLASITTRGLGSMIEHNMRLRNLTIIGCQHIGERERLGAIRIITTRNAAAAPAANADAPNVLADA